MSAAGPGRWSPSVYIGAVMLGVFVVLGLFGPLLAPHDVGPRAMDLDHMFAPMSWGHWLGTDKSGVDAVSQLMHGAREALLLSVIVVGISATIGVTVGMIAGYARGVVDEVIMRVVDILLAFPGLLLNIAIVAVVARPGLPIFIAALCANGWVGYARVARGQVLSLRERDYVLAARALGASTPRILSKHIAPNLMGPLLVQASLGFGGVIAAEAALSFLGLGPQLDYTWGAMLEQGTAFLWKPGFRHYALAAGFAIAWVVLAANLLGDGLRDRLDPRQRGRG
ncbi:MAG: ABC transporter permease [Kofleriaceae bacterium]